MSICEACSELLNKPARTEPHQGLVQETVVGLDPEASPYMCFYRCRSAGCTARWARHKTSTWLLWSDKFGEGSERPRTARDPEPA